MSSSAAATSSAAVQAQLSIVPAFSPLTTYTSYMTTTFVSDGITYLESQGVPVVVTNVAELSSLSAAGAFHTSASSSSALTGSQTVKGMSQGQEMVLRIKGANLTTSDPLQNCNSVSFHSSISRRVNWGRCRRRYWHLWNHPDTWPHWRSHLVPAATT